MTDIINAKYTCSFCNNTKNRKTIRIDYLKNNISTVLNIYCADCHRYFVNICQQSEWQPPIDLFNAFSQFRPQFIGDNFNKCLILHGHIALAKKLVINLDTKCTGEKLIVKCKVCNTVFLDHVVSSQPKIFHQTSSVQMEVVAHIM